MNKPLPPPPRSKPVNAAQPVKAPVNPDRFAITSGRITGPQRVVVYGTGGIGKSSLAALAPNPIFLDLESGTEELDVPRISIQSWTDLRVCLQSSKLDGYGSIVIDGGTKAEELAAEWTLQTVPHDKGHHIDRLEDYGYGKGLNHVYETYLLLMQEMDSQIRRGRNVVLICHDCINEVPNPVGENYIRYEPHLQSPKSGKASIRNRVVQWAAHVLFLSYDVAATKAGKGVGSGTRTIYTQEMPSHIAKTHGAASKDVEVPWALPYEKGDGAIWQMLLGGAK